MPIHDNTEVDAVRDDDTVDAGDVSTPAADDGA